MLKKKSTLILLISILTSIFISSPLIVVANNQKAAGISQQPYIYTNINKRKSSDKKDDLSSEIENAINSSQDLVYIPNIINESIKTITKLIPKTSESLETLKNAGLKELPITEKQIALDAIKDIKEFFNINKITFDECKKAFANIIQYKKDIKDNNALIKFDHDDASRARSSRHCKIFCKLLVRDYLDTNSLNVLNCLRTRSLLVTDDATIDGSLLVKGKLKVLKDFCGNLIKADKITASESMSTQELTVGPEQITRQANKLKEKPVLKVHGQSLFKDDIYVQGNIHANKFAVNTTTLKNIDVEGNIKSKNLTAQGTIRSSILRAENGIISNGPVKITNLPEGIVKTNSNGQLIAGALSNDDIAQDSITDDKLDTIITPGKVSNSATTATAQNHPNTIVKRNALGNFSAGIITADLDGNAATATTANTADSSVNFSGNLSGDVNGTQTSTQVDFVGGKTASEIATAIDNFGTATSDNIPNTVVKRDAGGDFSAGIIAADLDGNAATATTANTADSAVNFSGNLSGDVSGSQTSTQVDFVGGKAASEIATAIDNFGTATPDADPNTIVKRDALGNFSANAIFSNLFGDVVGSASNNVLKTGDTMSGSLTLSGTNSDLTVEGLATFANNTNFLSGVPGLPQRELLVTKGNISGPNMFNSIKAAIDSITDSSSTNRYIVRVGPGIYTEDTIVLPSFVTITGKSDLEVIIQPDSPNKNIIIGANNASIENCTLSGATGTSQAAIVFSSPGIFWVSNVKFGKNYTLISSTPSLLFSAIVMKKVFVEGDSNFTKGLLLQGNLGAQCIFISNDLTWVASGAQSQLDSVIDISGSGSTFIGYNYLLSGSGQFGNGLNVSNGANALLGSSTLINLNQAIYSPNIGGEQIIEISNVFARTNNQDIFIDNPFAQVTVTGTFSREKVYVNSQAQLSMSFNDSENPGTTSVGPQFSGQDTNTITNISTQIIQGSNIGITSAENLLSLNGDPSLVNIQAGNGYLMIGVFPDDYMQFIQWPNQTITLAPNTENFIYLNSNGVAQASLSRPDPIQTILLGKARTNSTGEIIYLQNISRDAVHTATLLDSTLRFALGNIYVSGSIVTKIGDLQLDVSPGTYYFGTHIYNPIGGSAISWLAFYRDGSGAYNIVNQNTVDYNQYDNGSGTLAIIPSGEYARHALYVVGEGAQEQYLFTYAQTTYSTLQEAENGVIPTPPATWSGNIALIASIIVQNTATPADQIAQIRDERPRLGFKSSGLTIVTDHGDLTGLLDDDHPQYLLVNGTRAMTGNLSLGNNNINNINNLNINTTNGTSISAVGAASFPVANLQPQANSVGLQIGSTSNNALSIGTNSFTVQGNTGNTTIAGTLRVNGQTTLSSLGTGVVHSNSTGNLSSTLITNTDIQDETISDAKLASSVTNLNIPNTIVKRDASGNFSAGTISADLSGNATSADSATTAIDFTGNLTGDLTGTQNATVVSSVGGQSAADIADATIAANNATSDNIVDTIVKRNSSGNFSAGLISADLNGNATTATNAETSTNFSGTLDGDVIGTQDSTVVNSVGGQTSADIASATLAVQNATSLNTPSTIVERDPLGNFQANTITATLLGNASTANSSTNFSGNLSGEVSGTQNSTIVNSVGGQNAEDIASATVAANAATSDNTIDTIVARDVNGNFSANTITADLNGTATSATNATNFTGNLSGDVAGTQSTTQVTSVGGESAEDIATATIATNNATSLNLANTIVRRDANGDFSANNISANLLGNASTSTTSTNFSGVLTGDVTGTQNSTQVTTVGGQSAASIATATIAANNATSTNLANSLVARDASGNFSANIITSDLNGNATTATTATNFSGNLSGDITGNQNSTTVQTVGGETAADIANATQTTNSATPINTPNTLVQRNESGDFAAGTITANLFGNAATATQAINAENSTNFTGNLIGDVTGTQTATVISTVGGQPATDIANATIAANSATSTNIADRIVQRNALGNFSANVITADLNGNATTATTANNSTNFTGNLAGDVSGTQNATVVNSVGGQTSTDIATATIAANSATSNNTPNSLVQRDASGDFSANSVTANLIGNVTGVASGNLPITGGTLSGSLLLSGSSSDLFVDGLSTFNSTNFLSGVPGIAKNEILVTQGTITGSNVFNSIKAAVDSITDSSPTNRYIVKVGPGIYTEDTITLPSYVTLIGQTDIEVIIQPDSPSKDLIIGANESSVENCTLQGATGPGQAAIVFDNPGVFWISNIKFGQNYTLLRSTPTVTLSAIVAKKIFFKTDSNFTNGFLLQGNNTGGRNLFISNDVSWIATGPQEQLQNVVNISGTESIFIGYNYTIIGSGQFGTGFNVSNNASLLLSSSALVNLNQGIYVPNIGSEQSIELSNVFTRTNNQDIEILNPNTKVSITGTFSREKVNIDPHAHLSMSFNDSENPGLVNVGPQFSGKDTETITNISTQIIQGSNIGITTAHNTLSVNTLDGTAIDIQAGNGYLMVGTFPDDYMLFVEWAAQTLTLPINADSFIYIDANGQAQSSQSPPNDIKTILLGKSRTDSSGQIIYIQEIPRDAVHTATLLDSTLRFALGNIFESGSLVTKNGNLQLDVTPGVYYFGTHVFNPIGGTPINWLAFFRNGIGNYNIIDQNTVDYNHYDDSSGTLADIPVGQYARHALYVMGQGDQERYLFTYAQTTYDTLQEAENGVIPIPPATWTSNIALIASIIVQNTATPEDQIVQIRDERPRLGFKASGLTIVTDHGDLTGLLDDDHPQYLLTNGNRTLTGNLNLGTNNIYNVNNLNISSSNGSSISALGATNFPVATLQPATNSIGLQIGATTNNAISVGTNNFTVQGSTGNTTISGSLQVSGQTTLSSLSSGLVRSNASGNLSSSLLTSADIQDGTITDAKLASAITSANIANTIVKRDASGNFAAGTITANLVGNSTTATSFTSNLSGDVTGPQNATSVSTIGGQSAANIASATIAANNATSDNVTKTIVQRDLSGNFSAGTITANLSGNATTADTATAFSGSLSGDVSGTQNSTVVNSVGGVTAEDIASATSLANNATSTNTADTIVRRNVSGNFSANTITANLIGNASSSTTSTNFTGSLSGDVTGTQSSTVVSTLGGQSATNISTATNLANNATSANTANTLIRRDGSGNFSASTITANLSGNATSATSANTAINFSGSLSGDVTGAQNSTVVTSVGGQPASNIASATTAANSATDENIPNTIIERDASGNFSAGTITANLAGNATTSTTSTNFSGSLSGDVVGTQSSTVVNTVGGASATNIATGTTLANAATTNNTANTIVRRDASGNFTAGTITANLAGNATTATSSTNFSGNLAGDVSGTQSSTTVNSVGGQTPANIASATVLANASTATNTANTIVRRNASGNFSAGTITANLAGNATTATTATNFSGNLSGDVTGIQNSTVVNSVGGQSAANVATGTALANAATNSNTANTIVRRDASGNFSAGTITATLNGAATSATTATTATNFSGTLSGNVSGTQNSTVVNSVGGQTATNIAAATLLANNATSANTANAIVRRDAAGNFSAGNITGTLTGNVTGRVINNLKVNAYATINQPIASSSPTIVRFDNDSTNGHFDPNNNFDITTFTYTAPFTGAYMVNAVVSTRASGSSLRTIALVRNGVVTVGYSVATEISNNTTGALVLPTVIMLTAGDALNVSYTGNNGDVIQANNTSLSIHYISG